MAVPRHSLVCLSFLLSFTICFAAEDCLKVYNLTSKKVESVPPSTPVSEVPHNIKCYSRCIIDEYFGDDDKIDLKRLENRARDDEKVILADCKQKYDDDSSDRCDYAYKIIQCLYLGRVN
ncbi:Odorant-binding protein 18a [Drosophila ananassae]|uniref:Odorant-binding protein 18a n=1 Tax=Drosophila ananassae TaxID=7217 RepID=B3N165_DROAN|nr:general odorant-binding protein 57c [Drosophila ananassae]EDV30100.2 Odorant-binding protein 18a [Drosophila ananassae]